MESSVAEQNRVMNYSLGVAIVLVVLKCLAALKTGSAAIFSDALESVVHVVAVGFAAWALRFSRKPADEEHQFGHDKAAFLSTGFEGAMIGLAALFILFEAAKQSWQGFEIENLGLGTWLTTLTLTINLILGLSLLHVGKKRASRVLRANGLHVLTDVLTSVGVLVALLLIWLTGWKWWDPICASLCGLNILWTGFRLIRECISGLLDECDPEKARKIRETMDQITQQQGIGYHNFRYRHSGCTDWVEFHLVFDDWVSIHNAHEIATKVEAAVANSLHPSQTRVISHLEPASTAATEEVWEAK